MPCDEETVRKIAREVFQEELKKMGIDVAKLGGSAAVGALITALVTNRDKITSMLSGGKGETQPASLPQGTGATVVERSPVEIQILDEIRKIERDIEEIEEELLPGLRKKYLKGEITKEEYENLQKEYEEELERLRRKKRALLKV